jgi:hypothetical protein
MHLEGLNLPKYVSLLKNLRAVAFVDPNAPPPMEEIRWLRRKYKYRNIGVSRSLLKALQPKIKEIFLKKPFKTLESPISEIEDFIRTVSKIKMEVPNYIVESLVFASCYVNPIVVLGRDSLPILSPLVAWSMKSTTELPEVEIKRNLRIIGYAILDFHEKVIGEAYKSLRKIAEELKKGEKFEKVKNDVEKLIKKRINLAKKDGEKRFWKLRQTGGEEERVVIAYLDIIPLISKIFLQKRMLRLVNFIIEGSLNLSMALSLVPTFILQLSNHFHS